MYNATKQNLYQLPRYFALSIKSITPISTNTINPLLPYNCGHFTDFRMKMRYLKINV